MSPALYRVVAQNRATDTTQAADNYSKNIHPDNCEPGGAGSNPAGRAILFSHPAKAT